MVLSLSHPRTNSNPKPLAALSQILAERPVAFWQIFLTLGAIEVPRGSS